MEGPRVSIKTFEDAQTIFEINLFVSDIMPAYLVAGCPTTRIAGNGLPTTGSNQVSFKKPNGHKRNLLYRRYTFRLDIQIFDKGSVYRIIPYLILEQITSKLRKILLIYSRQTTGKTFIRKQALL